MSKQRPLFVPRGEYKSFLLSVFMTTVKMLAVLMLLVAFSLGGVVMGIAKAWIDSSPGIDSLMDVFDTNNLNQTSFVYDKYGNVITEFRGSENRIYVDDYDEFGENLINAVVAVEDSRFWSHSGVDLKRYVGALVGNVLSGGNQGGSTITCQLIKQTLLTDEQTYKRKVQEAYLALQLEEDLTYNEGSSRLAKERILKEYLNIVYMGGSLYGVKTAAIDYFGKDNLRDLTLKECAMLARLIRNPSRYNPRSNFYIRETPEVSNEGANYVLKLMYEQGYISESEYNEAVNETLCVYRTVNDTDSGTYYAESALYDPNANSLNITHLSDNDKYFSMVSTQSVMYDNAYYVEYAIYDVVTKMLRKEKLEDNASNRSLMETRLRTGGYHIYTCLDPEVQKSVQSIVENWTKYPKTRYNSDAIKKTLDNGSYIDVIQPQAAVAVMDWHTGELIAIVGGRSEPTARKQLNRAYQSNMPVGSSIKPLSVYGPAFDLGYSPNTPLLNLPIPINGWDSATGYPTNYGGGSYSGVESMRTAINKSHNYSTAQALFEYVGISNSVNYLLRLGISSKHIQATGSGLALGSSGISVIEMADAFGAIANQGEYRESYAFSAVLYPDNSTPYISIGDIQQTRQVFKRSTAWMLIDVLSDCVTSNGTGSSAVFGNFNNSRVSHSIAGKTGTNSDYCGVFFAGMTAYYSCAVWIGHDNYKPLVTNATGGTYAAPLWSSIMQKVHEIKGTTTSVSIISDDYRSFGLVRAEACSVSGMRATNACRNDNKGYKPTTDYYLEGTQPTVNCNMHIMVTLCTRSNRRATAYCSSTRTVGVIYIPEGHPLRMAQSLSDVQRYFPYATISDPYPQCTTCR